MKTLTYEVNAMRHAGNVPPDSNCIKILGRRTVRVDNKIARSLHGGDELAEGGSRIKDRAVPLLRNGNYTRCGAVMIGSSDGAQAR